MDQYKKIDENGSSHVVKVCVYDSNERKKVPGNSVISLTSPVRGRVLCSNVCNLLADDTSNNQTRFLFLYLYWEISMDIFSVKSSQLHFTQARFMNKVI